MLVSAEAQLHGQVDEQQAFSLVHAGDPGRVYCLGIETPTGVLAVWLDPSTGKPTFGCYLDIQDAVNQLRYTFGGTIRLELVMDDGPGEPNLETKYEEVILVKAALPAVCLNPGTLPPPRQ